MGVGASNELGPLAVAAVAEITRCECTADSLKLLGSSPPDAKALFNVDHSFDLDHLRVLRQHFQGLLLGNNHDDEEELPMDDADSSKQHHDHALSLRNEPNLSQVHFEEALDRPDFFVSDRAIFDKIFTLMDRTGDAVILAPEFLISTCALLKGDLAAKLQAAFELLQNQEKPQGDGIMISKEELAFVLITMTQMATYFSDPPMLKANVLSIVDDIFTLGPPPPIEEEEGGQEAQGEEPDETLDANPHSSSLSSAEVAARVVQHHTVDSYIRGHFVRRGTIVY